MKYNDTFEKGRSCSSYIILSRSQKSFDFHNEAKLAFLLNPGKTFYHTFFIKIFFNLIPFRNTHL